MLVSEFCNRDVVIIDQEATILDAAKLMCSEHVGDLVVVDKRNDGTIPIGILTDRDIVIRVLAEEIDLNIISVGDAMTYELHRINEKVGLPETLEKMRRHGVRRLPVVDAEGALVGIVTSDDLTELIAEQLNNLVLLVGNELASEKARRD